MIKLLLLAMRGNVFIFRLVMQAAVQYAKTDPKRCSIYTKQIRRNVKAANKVVFQSEKFGVVILVRKGLVERETYYKGQLTHDWHGIVMGDQCHNPGNVIENFYFHKGQVIWLSKEYFKKL